MADEAKSEYDYALIHIPNMQMAFVTKHDERTVEISLKAFCTYRLTPEEICRTLIKTPCISSYIRY